MGLFSKKNIDKAKALAEKNAGKIASGVDKATDTVNKKTGGKYSKHLDKVDGAAKKFARDSGQPTPPAAGADAATRDDAGTRDDPVT